MSKDLERRCAEIADRIEPSFRVDRQQSCSSHAAKRWSAAFAAAYAALEPPIDQHADDLAVDRLAVAMKFKLAKKRGDGRSGWEDPQQCSAEQLSLLLREHVDKGDPVDVANLAMMLQQRGERIASSMQIAAWEDLRDHRHG